MPQTILIDSDILIDFGRGVKETAEYLASTSATTTLTISTITQMELIVGCRDKLPYWFRWQAT